MSGYTPGPWEINNLSSICSAVGAESGDGYKADQYDCWLIAECDLGMTLVSGQMISLGPDVVKANASLIAAAPELLEALEAMVEYVDFMHSIGHLQRPVQSSEACAAIAKAKGLA